MSLILTFFYIFAFPLGKIPVIDSSWLALIICGLYALLSTRYRYYLQLLFRWKRIYQIIGMILLTCGYAALSTIIAGKNDFSFITTLFHQIVAIILGIITIAYLLSNNKNILEKIIEAFCVQGCLQLLSMFSNTFRTFTNIFRPESAIITGQWKYSGIRGLAVSGYAFFGLAVAFGLVFILWALYSQYVFIQTPTSIKFLMVVIMLFGGMSAGRTSLIGAFIALIIYIINHLGKYVISLRKFVGIISTLIMAVVGVTLIVKSGILQTGQIQNLRNYVTEFTRTGTTTSGNELFTEMYFPVSISTFFFGDGIYTTAYGYYMNTDAGYMRVILYFGFFGMLLLLFVQLLYFNKKEVLNTKIKYIIIAFILLVQIKGEVLGFLIIVESILLMLYFFNEKKYTEMGRYNG